MAAGFRPGQYSDGPSLKCGYSLSVASGVVASYPWAGSVPCGLPAAQVPILIEVSYSVMLPQVTVRSLTDVHSYMWPGSAHSLYRQILPLQWSSALLWWHPPNHAV
jgi:hypothetical protein